MARMLSSHALWTVARIEVKTLLRSWFFRILASLSLGLLVFVNLSMYTDVFHTPWMFRSISSAIPYFNIILLNLAQAVVASFLASDFLKRDRKLDSTDVVYSKSMSNGDYIIGKTLGILIVFGGLNAAALGIALVFNGVFSGVPVALRAYLFYPLLISLPTLVYILGLSFLLMAVIRNQAVTLIVLLGYIGTALIYLGPRVNLIYDYMAFHLPMLYSGFVGFGGTAEILLHRGMYLFLGVAFILGAVPLLRRLPQSKNMIRISRVLAVIFAAAAVTSGGLYLERRGSAAELREGMRALDNRLAGEPRIAMKRCHLDVRHDGAEIQGTARITVRNESDRPIEHYRFGLNPALTVTSVEAGGGGLPFERELHMVSISPPGPLPPGGTDSLVLSYRGGIDDEACYLDVDEKQRDEPYRIALYSVDKRYGFVTPRYVLLTPETMWYPTPCIAFSPDRPIRHDGEFTLFSMDVSTDDGLTALSQGAARSSGGGGFAFSPETPLPGLTLCIGEYEMRAVTVDSITYSVALRAGHDAFTPYLAAIADTLPDLIRELKGDYERMLELSYPFSRLTLVEAPVQFHGYPRLWTVSQETVQPEMILLPERAANLASADFRLFMDRPRRRGRPDNEQTTPREQQIRAFQQFVQSTIAGNIQRETFRRRRMGMMEATYNIFPNYFSLVTHLRSERLPILSVALESFILGRIVQPVDPVFKSFIGLTGAEKANLALGEQSLEEILADPERSDIFSSVLESKGEYLFVMIQERIGGEEFSAYLADFIARNRFRTVDAADFIADMGGRYEIDLEPFIDRWYRGRELPSYLTGRVAAYQVMDGDRTRYQVKFTASNTSPEDGFLRVTLRAGGRRRFGMGGMDEASSERIISLQGTQTKECGIILDFKPRMMLVSTLVSRNIPVELSTNFAEFELDERARPFDGERLLETPLRVTEPGEIVVDNEDEGFEAGGKTTHGFLGLRFRQRSERDDEKYEGIRFWNLPDNRWVPVTHSDFYGVYVRSAVYTKAGKGGTPASWTASIPESGSYEVYYYVSKIRRPWGRGSGDKLGQYHFEIVHDDGADEVALDIDEAETGWNYLGTYYLSSGEASIRLTNESNGLMVIADAAKWVKR